MFKIEANPASILRGNVAFSNGDNSWSEAFDVVDALASALIEHGHTPSRRGDEIALLESGLTLVPGVVGDLQVERNGV